MENKDKLGMHANASPEIFQYAKMLRSNMTIEEKIVWGFLKHKPHGFKFRRQHPFNNYVLDFYCHKLKLSIEIDGGNHKQEQQKSKDLVRSTIINSYGVKEVRYTNEDIRFRFEDVKNELLKALETY